MSHDCFDSFLCCIAVCVCVRTAESFKMPESNSICKALIVTCVVAILLFIIAIPVSLVNRNSVHIPPAVFMHAPGDTRVVSYSSFFCAGINLTDKSVRTGASLYLITKVPPLTNQNSFTINSSLNIAENKYHFWNYYLHPNSSFTTVVCVVANSGTFYLIQGRQQFASWIDEPDAYNAIESFRIESLCSETKHDQYTYIAMSADEYYFVFYSSESATLQLNVEISIKQSQYSTLNLQSPANCSVPPVGECTLTVPYGSDYQALIAADIPKDVDWEESVDIDWHCVNRKWAYAVAMLVPIVGMSYALLLGLFCYIKSMNSQESIWCRWKSIMCRTLSWIPKVRLTRRPGNLTTYYGAIAVAYSSK